MPLPTPEKFGGENPKNLPTAINRNFGSVYNFEIAQHIDKQITNVSSTINAVKLYQTWGHHPIGFWCYQSADAHTHTHMHTDIQSQIPLIFLSHASAMLAWERGIIATAGVDWRVDWPAELRFYRSTPHSTQKGHSLSEMPLLVGEGCLDRHHLHGSLSPHESVNWRSLAKIFYYNWLIFEEKMVKRRRDRFWNSYFEFSNLTR